VGNKEERDEERKPRSINLPAWLWDELDKDARRCRRSTTKQLEAFLTLCYDSEVDMEIKEEKVRDAYEAASYKRLKKDDSDQSPTPANHIAPTDG
jgi:hypothetical protein